MSATRSLLPFLFLAFSLPAFAQEQIQLQISNPHPRVGESFTVSFAMDFFNEQMSEQLEQHGSLEAGTPSFNRQYSRTLTATKAGSYSIGPLSFTFNGTTYTSNQVTIEVVEPLARQEGIWLRQVRLDDEEFLILEQMIRDQKSEYSQADFDAGKEQVFDKPYASLLKQPATGLTMNLRGSSTGTCEDKEEKGDLSLGYSMRVYRIEKEAGFAGSLQLKPEHFQNLPANAQLPTLVLR